MDEVSDIATGPLADAPVDDAPNHHSEQELDEALTRTQMDSKMDRRFEES